MLGRVGPTPFLLHKDASSWNWLQWVFMSAESLGRHLCPGRRTCPTRAGFMQLCPAGEPAAGNSTGLMLGTLLGGGGYLYVFSHFVLCLLLCVG